MQDWIGVDGEIARHVQERTTRTLDTYRADAKRIEEDLNEEARVRGGGYGRRQIFELVQNGADAIFESGSPGRVYVLVTSESLYCANEGAPINEDGVTAILMAHMSRKRGALIGRFGLGFKSVLGVCTAPVFFSRSGSFYFDAQRAKAEVRQATGYVGDTAVLRLAWALDPEHSAGTDPILRELMGWATTVIKLPLVSPETRALIAEELRTFPAEFLLFTPLVSELILEDKVAGVGREIRCLRDGDGTHRLFEGQAETAWRIFQLDVPTEELTPDEREDGSEQCRERPTIPLLWAARVGVTGGGRSLFWAFFPTDTETTLSGILNAPWKTNTDRQNLLEGPFNRALIDRATVCVARALPRLVTRDDPGGVLDLLPARTDDARNWADRRLSERLDAELRKLPFLGCRTGALRAPEDLRVRPEVVLKLDHGCWAPNGVGVEASENWCHPSVERTGRRARATRLGAKTATIGEWLTDVAAPKTPQASTSAILLAGRIWATLPQEEQGWERERFATAPDPHKQIKQASIVLTRAGTLAALGDELYLGPGDAPETPPEKLVAEDVATHQDLADVWRRLGVRDAPDVSPSTKLRNALRADEVDWKAVWAVAAEVEVWMAARIIRESGQQPQVMTLAGELRPILETLLPGAVVPADGSRDARVAVDTNFHEETLPLLRALGATDVPLSSVTIGWELPPRQVRGWQERSFDLPVWYSEYRQDCVRRYREWLSDRRPDSQLEDRCIGFQEEMVERYQGKGLYLGVSGAGTCAGPLGPLPLLEPEGAVLFCERLIRLARRGAEWTCRHVGTSQRKWKDLAIHVDSPPWWAIKRYGWIPTSLGPRRVPDTLHPSLDEWSRVLPVAECDAEVANILGLPNSLEEAPDALLSQALEQTQVLDDAKAAHLYGVAACRGIQAPTRIRCQVGRDVDLRAPATVRIADNEETATVLASAGAAWVLIANPEHRRALVEQWGLQQACAQVDYTPSGEDTLLLDLFPGLRQLGKPELESWVLRPCSRLCRQSESLGGHEDVSFLREGHILYYLVDVVDDAKLLDHVLQELGFTATEHVRETLGWLQRPERQQRVDRVRACEDLPGKLIAAVGEDALRTLLPQELLAWLADRMPSGEDIAKAVLAIHGVEVLCRLRGALEAAGFDPPRQWNGSARAKEFVLELGFPEEYAGFRPPRREPFLDIEGPVVLQPLHDYQKPIVERIGRLLQESPPGRALLSLPTGAGKTRVTVEALIRWFRDQSVNQSVKRMVLWIAQTDELCEQAVQCWQQAWRALGPAERRLRICRFWGHTASRVAPLQPGEPQVVAATYQTLNQRIEREDTQWLREAQCVVIDEAHGSTTRSYTHILGWLDLTFRQTSRTLIGLTATPFRGIDEEETQRLVDRYHGRRLDEGVLDDPDPYRALQRGRFLAQVEFRSLEGAALELDEKERSEVDEFHEVPASASARLGVDPERNRRIIDSVLALPDDWSVLLFAASVPHAELMAAMLNATGIVARAISGRTDRSARRHYVEQFRAKQIRVLTNYDVLATGFDAPAVRALYITRPVYSRGRYQQMIGRGLRGPQNGGTERCLIVNVEDNIVNYGGQLAFRHFEHLWTGGER